MPIYFSNWETFVKVGIIKNIVLLFSVLDNYLWVSERQDIGTVLPKRVAKSKGQLLFLLLSLGNFKLLEFDFWLLGMEILFIILT